MTTSVKVAEINKILNSIERVGMFNFFLTKPLIKIEIPYESINENDVPLMYFLNNQAIMLIRPCFTSIRSLKQLY